MKKTSKQWDSKVTHDLGPSLGFAIADIEEDWKYHFFSLYFSFLKFSNDGIILDGLCYILQFNSAIMQIWGKPGLG